MPVSARLILLATLTFSLTACSAITNDDPKPMARGYASYAEPYKSAPGPAAPSIGYPYSMVRNNAVVEDMRYAAADLVAKLDKSVSFSDDKIFLAHTTQSPFYNTLDYLLRDELTKGGYVVVGTSQGAVPITVTADEANPAPEKEEPAAKSIYRPLRLSLIVGGTAGKPARHVSGVYELPTYGFAPTTVAETEEKKPEKKTAPKAAAPKGTAKVAPVTKEPITQEAAKSKPIALQRITE
jgi:hypothetical protein